MIFARIHRSIALFTVTCIVAAPLQSMPVSSHVVIPSRAAVSVTAETALVASLLTAPLLRRVVDSRKPSVTLWQIWKRRPRDTTPPRLKPARGTPARFWQRAAVTASLAAIAMGLGVPTRANGPYIPYMGVYRLNTQPAGMRPYTFVDETAGYVNLVMSVESDLSDYTLMQRYIQNGVWIILHFASTPEYLENKAGAYTTALANAKRNLIQSGAASRLVGVDVGEEWNGGLNDGFFDTAPNGVPTYPTLYPYRGQRLAQADALRGLLEARFAEVKATFPPAQFPNVHTVIVDGLWNNNPTYGNNLYFPAPRNMDVIGMDPYFGGDNSVCNIDTRKAFDQSTRFYVEYAIATLNRPILLVAPVFRHKPSRTDWQVAPAPCQMEWYYQLALDHPGQIPALLWFAYGYDNSPGNLVMGARHPALYAQFLKLAEIFFRNKAHNPSTPQDVARRLLQHAA